MSFDPEEIRLYSSPDKIDSKLWNDLAKADPDNIAVRTGVVYQDGCYEVALLNQKFTVRPGKRSITGPGGRPVKFQEGLVSLVYLTSSGPGGLAGQRVPLGKLPGGALFFAKTHTPATDELAADLNLDQASFENAGQGLGGRPTGHGDASWLIMALPQIPLEAVFFRGDEEFAPRINLLIDAAADHYLDLGTLWAMINLLAQRIAGLVKQE